MYKSLHIEAYFKPMPFVILCNLMLAGCADWQTINRKRDVSNTTAQAVFLDAKQRAILSSPIKDKDTKEIYVRFCAEPSPDALSALAAQMGVNLSIPEKASLAANYAVAEGAANIGLRTGSIQLLRDISYRNCEAYLNGSITPFGLETMQRRFQSTVVALLAIEQLTGAVRPTAVALSGQTKANDAETLGAAIKLVNETSAAFKMAAAKQVKAEAASDEAQKKLKDYAASKPNDTSSADYTNLKKAADTAEAELKTAKEEVITTKADLDKANSVREAALISGGSTATTSSIAKVSEKPLDKESITALSKAIAGIVDKTLELQFGKEICTTVIGQAAGGYDFSEKGESAKAVFESCLSRLNNGKSRLMGTDFEIIPE